jgi:2-phospho-L-lactate transferase/gluconeogenesis factor (CofD/UPF0052 family)
MAMAMAEIARALTYKGDIEATKKIVNKPVTAEELLMLQKFGLESKCQAASKSAIQRARYVRWDVVFNDTASLSNTRAY